MHPNPDDPVINFGAMPEPYIQVRMLCDVGSNFIRYKWSQAGMLQ